MFVVLLIMLFIPQHFDAPVILDQPDTIYSDLIIKLPPDTVGQAVLIKADNITLCDSVIDGGFVGRKIGWQQNYGIMAEYCRDLKIINCQVVNAGFDGIILRYCDNALIEKNTVTKCGEGILLEFSHSCRVFYNVVSDIGNLKHTTQDGIEWSRCFGGHGENNILRDINGSGYDIFNSSEIIIKDSILYDCDTCKQGLCSISIQGTDGRSDNNYVTGNIIAKSNNAAAIGLYRASMNLITENIIKEVNGVDGDCILIGDNVSNNNLIIENTCSEFKGEVVHERNKIYQRGNGYFY